MVHGHILVPVRKGGSILICWNIWCDKGVNLSTVRNVKRDLFLLIKSCAKGTLWKPVVPKAYILCLARGFKIYQ